MFMHIEKNIEMMDVFFANVSRVLLAPEVQEVKLVNLARRYSLINCIYFLINLKYIIRITFCKDCTLGLWIALDQQCCQ